MKIQRFPKKKVKIYERDKLKYYFGVVECNDTSTAEHLYKQLDGQEYGVTSNRLDVRYIPDDLSFNDRKVHDEATEVPTDYTAPDFLTRVLGATNVDSTWEQNDPKRTRLVKNFFLQKKKFEIVILKI